MVERVLEGTWEEIQEHAGDLTGRQLRIYVLEDSPETLVPAPAGEDTSASLADLLTGYIGVIRSNEGRGGSRLSEKTGADFAEGMAEKQRQSRL